MTAYHMDSVEGGFDRPPVDGEEMGTPRELTSSERDMEEEKVQALIEQHGVSEDKARQLLEQGVEPTEEGEMSDDASNSDEESWREAA